MQKSIRLVFCTDGIFPHKVGGIQRHSRLLIEHLADYQDLEIAVIHPHEENTFDRFENITELRVDDIDKDKNYFLELYRYSKQTADYLKELQPDVIYAQGFTVWNSINEFKDRLIINPHGLEPWQTLSIKDKIIGMPFRLVQRYLFKRANKTVSLGGQLTSILEKVISKDQITVLPNAVSISNGIKEKQFPDSKESEPTKVLFVGRFAANKGIHLLVEAISQLNDQGYKSRFEFHFAGKGPLYKGYKRKYSFQNVKFWGFVSDEKLEELYKSSHLFILPTLFEGMPTVVLEAMSKQLPIIVSNTGATSEQVDEKNGYLIKKNNVGEIKRALLNFQSLSADEKKNMGRKSYKKVTERFTWEKVAEQHYQLFTEL